MRQTKIKRNGEMKTKEMDMEGEGKSMIQNWVQKNYLFMLPTFYLSI